MYIYKWMEVSIAMLVYPEDTHSDLGGLRNGKYQTRRRWHNAFNQDNQSSVLAEDPPP